MTVAPLQLANADHEMFESFIKCMHQSAYAWKHMAIRAMHAGMVHKLLHSPLLHFAMALYGAV